MTTLLIWTPSFNIAHDESVRSESKSDLTHETVTFFLYTLFTKRNAGLIPPFFLVILGH